MSVFSRSATPITITIGRQFTLPATYTDPTSGAPISTAGMTIDAALEWTGQAAPVPLNIESRDDAAASLILSLDAVTSAGLPADRVMTLRISYTDSLGSTDDILYPAWGVVP